MSQNQTKLLIDADEGIFFFSNDIETNPRDLRNGFFTFCNWNINSLAKDDFYRINIIEALNSTCDYDIISLCETSLNEATQILLIE